MALVLPQSTDLLSAKDHSRLHRVLAFDASTPDQSMTMDATGNATFTGTVKGAGWYYAVVVKTGTYNPTTINDDVIICNSATPFTITLFAATGTKKVHFIKNVSTGLVTVDAGSGKFIDGTQIQTVAQSDCMMVIDYAANNWAII